LQQLKLAQENKTKKEKTFYNEAWREIEWWRLLKNIVYF